MTPKRFFSLLQQHNRVNSVDENKNANNKKEIEPFTPKDLLSSQ